VTQRSSDDLSSERSFLISLARQNAVKKSLFVDKPRWFHYILLQGNDNDAYHLKNKESLKKK